AGRHRSDLGLQRPRASGTPGTMQLRSCVVALVMCGGSLLVREAYAQSPGDGPPPPPPSSMEPPPPPPSPMEPPPPPPSGSMQPPPPMMQPGLVNPEARTHHGVFVRMLIGPG